MVRQEGDEYVCDSCTCGKKAIIRWGIDETNDICPRGPNYVGPPFPPAPPKPTLNLLRRACYALGKEPRPLAHLLGVSYKQELEPLIRVPDRELSDLDMDEVFVKLEEHVNRKLGLLLAVRADMQRIMQAQRTKRAARREAIRNR